MNISVFYTCKKIVSLYHDFYPDFDMEEFNYLNEVFKFPLEKRILLTASVLYEKREIEKDKFYFKFASYGFAFLVTGMFVVLMFVSMNMMKLYIFIPLVLLGLDINFYAGR